MAVGIELNVVEKKLMKSILESIMTAIRSEKKMYVVF